MDRILVATDFSSRSDRALRRSALIARRVGASLTLLHVVDRDQQEAMISAGRDAALSALEAAAGTLRDEENIRVDVCVKVEDVCTGILDATEETGTDLVILGPHRRRLKDVFTGTTVERVVRRTRVPLLVAVQAPTAPYRRTMLALDFDEASRSAGRAALSMNLFEHTDVIVMHAFDTPAKGMLKRSLEPHKAVRDYVANESSAAVERLRILSAELGLPPSEQRVVAIMGSPARSIGETAVSADAQLIVLGTNQRKGIERVLIGSVTEDVIRETGRDVLIIPVDE